MSNFTLEDIQQLIQCYDEIDQIEDRLYCLDEKSNWTNLAIQEIRNSLILSKRNLQKILLTTKK
jgi:hypothetical protein